MTSYCLSRWCIGAQLKIHVLHTTEVGGLSSTEKSFHVVRACAQCVCLVSLGPKTKGFSFCSWPFQALPFLFNEIKKETEKESETERERKRERKRVLRDASSFSWLYDCSTLRRQTRAVTKMILTGKTQPRRLYEHNTS